MWSRRAQEYETKIKSGDPVSIAEVVRDLHRRTNQSEQSYSERQMYQAALERLAREFAAIEKIDQDAAALRLEDLMDAAQLQVFLRYNLAVGHKVVRSLNEAGRVSIRCVSQIDWD